MDPGVHARWSRVSQIGKKRELTGASCCHPCTPALQNSREAKDFPFELGFAGCSTGTFVSVAGWSVLGSLFTSSVTLATRYMAMSSRVVHWPRP